MSRIITNRSKTPAGCLIPFGVIFLLAGLGICWFAWTGILTKVRKVRSWTEIPCRVTEWETSVEPADGVVYRPLLKLAYQYETAGRSWTDTTYNAATDDTPGLNELEEKGVAARAGGTVCYVNPEDPGDASFIRPGYEAGSMVLGFGAVFAIVGGSLAAGGMLSVLRRVAGGGAAAPVGIRGCAGGIVAPFFFAIFAIAGFAVWKFAIHNQPDWKTIGARMVEVPARVLASGVVTSRSSGKNKSTTYKAKVAFEYDFNGRTWKSGWLNFDRGTTSSSNQGKARDAANRYPAGKTARAWVDPDAPWQAVLEKDSGSRWWLWLFPIIFGGIGILGLGGWLFKLTAIGAALLGTKRSTGI